MMSYPVKTEPAAHRDAEVAARAARTYRNPLRGDARFHEERDLVRVIERLRVLAAQS